ncbi:MAG: stalk domain-containing protein [Caldisericia bacterium]
MLTQIDPDNPDVVTTIIDDRTMVPMRFLAENLGCKVEWIAETEGDCSDIVKLMSF